MREPLGVVARRDEERAGDIDADASKSEQVGRGVLREPFELGVERIDLAIKLSPALRESAKDELSGRHRVRGVHLAKLARVADQGGQ